ncbi:hypothetical protein QR680_008156 [Steinernema hermaphroditum]|uniref:Uncharacterized protein n=1 Tax=Steinernema hermaphroditum TaxID=289476 RepID=A0AA39IHT5_9BILA|nr:hypothetical protein QR680_008156 [Steinernema hermaphroditum]
MPLMLKFQADMNFSGPFWIGSIRELRIGRSRFSPESRSASRLTRTQKGPIRCSLLPLANKRLSLVAENLKSFEISLSDVVGITRDGAANMAAMCDTLGVTSIHCFCHNLHLIVKSSLERCVKADELVKKAIDIVASFRRSNSQVAALAEVEKIIEKERNGPESNFTPTLLKTACPTRWNSVIECVRSVVEKEEVLIRYAKSAANRRSVQASSITQLRPVDFDDLRHIMITLKPLEQATNLYKSNDNIELACFLDPRFHRKRFLPVSTWNEIEALLRRRLLGELASKSTHPIGEKERNVDDEIKRFKEATMEELPMPNDYAHRRCLQCTDNISENDGNNVELIVVLNFKKTPAVGHQQGVEEAKKRREDAEPTSV